MRDPWKSTQLSVHQMIPVPSKWNAWEQFLRQNKKKKVMYVYWLETWNGKQCQLLCQGSLLLNIFFSPCHQIITHGKRNNKHRETQKTEQRIKIGIIDSILYIFYSSTCPGTQTPKYMLYQFTSLHFMDIYQSKPCTSLPALLR